MNRPRKAFWNPYYKTDKLEEVVPYEFVLKGKVYTKVQEYPNIILYQHSYGNGRYFECFDRYDLKVYERYGKEM